MLNGDFIYLSTLFVFEHVIYIEKIFIEQHDGKCTDHMFSNEDNKFQIKMLFLSAKKRNNLTSWLPFYIDVYVTYRITNSVRRY